MINSTHQLMPQVTTEITSYQAQEKGVTTPWFPREICIIIGQMLVEDKGYTAAHIQQFFLAYLSCNNGQDFAPSSKSLIIGFLEYNQRKMLSDRKKIEQITSLEIIQYLEMRASLIQLCNERTDIKTILLSIDKIFPRSSLENQTFSWYCDIIDLHTTQAQLFSCNLSNIIYNNLQRVYEPVKFGLKDITKMIRGCCVLYKNIFTEKNAKSTIGLAVPHFNDEFVKHRYGTYKNKLEGASSLEVIDYISVLINLYKFGVCINDRVKSAKTFYIAMQELQFRLSGIRTQELISLFTMLLQEPGPSIVDSRDKGKPVVHQAPAVGQACDMMINALQREFLENKANRLQTMNDEDLFALVGKDSKINLYHHKLGNRFRMAIETLSL